MQSSEMREKFTLYTDRYKNNIEYSFNRSICAEISRNYMNITKTNHRIYMPGGAEDTQILLKFDK